MFFLKVVLEFSQKSYIFKAPTRASLAQLVEQLTCNQQVVGSTPTAGSIFFLKNAEKGTI